MSGAAKPKSTTTSKTATPSLPKVAAKASSVKSPATVDSGGKATAKQQTKLPVINNKPKAASANESQQREQAAPVQAEPVANSDMSDGTSTVTAAALDATTISNSGQASPPPIAAEPAPDSSAESKLQPDTEVSVATEHQSSHEVVEITTVKRDGEVKLIYEQYSEMFPIVNGSTTQENIDEVYCLSFVMPNCLVHLSVHDPPTKRQLEIEERFDELFLPEIPRGTFQNLVADQTYYVYVEQESAQLERDQAMTRLRLQNDPTALAALKKDDGRVLESCSCIYGNPCVDEYGCRDWANRYAVATKNGWKGF